MQKLKDMKNMKFNMLTAKEYIGNGKWLCVCDCGKETIVPGEDLRRNKLKSCGCLRSPYKKYKSDERFKRLYNIWRNMIKRCHNKSDNGYYKYGAKGIKVCDEWRNDFGAFFSWSINNGYHEVEGEYKDILSIDRIDSKKGYSPDNCRWIPISENSARVSHTNKKLEELNKKSSNELVQNYLERKMENNQEIQQTKRNLRNGTFFCKKPNYCIIRNCDGTQQFLFKSFVTVALFLQISSGAISYRIKNKNGVLNDTWKIEKISKEEFDEIRKKGIEVIV